MSLTGCQQRLALTLIRADRHAYYETVAQVMATAAKSGLVRIGFVTNPSQP